jgi:hypothetical protein
MRSRIWLYACAAVLFTLATSVSFAQGNSQGHGKGHDKNKHGDRDDDDRDRGDRHGYSDHDRDAMQGWYRDHRSNLPPGLAKRDRLPPGLERQLVARGTLPPGLRKKIQPCPYELEERLPPPPPDYRHVVISGHIVLLNTRNFFIADVIHFDVR